MVPSSADGAEQPAIDRYHRAGDVAAAWRHQQSDKVCYVVDSTDAPDRHFLLKRAAHFLGRFLAGGEHLLQALRIDVTGTDGVDVDAEARRFERQCLGVANHCTPACHRKTKTR